MPHSRYKRKIFKAVIERLLLFFVCCLQFFAIPFVNVIPIHVRAETLT